MSLAATASCCFLIACELRPNYVRKFTLGPFITSCILRENILRLSLNVRNDDVIRLIFVFCTCSIVSCFLKTRRFGSRCYFLHRLKLGWIEQCRLHISAWWRPCQFPKCRGLSLRNEMLQNVQICVRVSWSLKYRPPNILLR